jgi:hypothetical protein
MIGAWAIVMVLNLIYIKLMSDYPMAMSKMSIVVIELMMVGVAVAAVVTK